MHLSIRDKVPHDAELKGDGWYTGTCRNCRQLLAQPCSLPDPASSPAAPEHVWIYVAGVSANHWVLDLQRSGYWEPHLAIPTTDHYRVFALLHTRRVPCSMGQFLETDEYYRNQFETKTSCGAIDDGNETRMRVMSRVGFLEGSITCWAG